MVVLALNVQPEIRPSKFVPKDTIEKYWAASTEKAFGGAKRLFHQSTWESLETQMELEAQAIARSGHTADFREGVTAFASKKTPVFRGA